MNFIQLRMRNETIVCQSYGIDWILKPILLCACVCDFYLRTAHITCKWKNNKWIVNGLKCEMQIKYKRKSYKVYVWMCHTSLPIEKERCWIDKQWRRYCEKFSETMRQSIKWFVNISTPISNESHSLCVFLF